MFCIAPREIRIQAIMREESVLFILANDQSDGVICKGIGGAQDAASAGLIDGGHEVRRIDLYACQPTAKPFQVCFLVLFLYSLLSFAHKRSGDIFCMTEIIFWSEISHMMCA